MKLLLSLVLNDQRTIVEVLSGFISKNPKLTNGRLIKFVTGDVILPSLDNHNIGFPQKSSLKSHPLSRQEKVWKLRQTSWQKIDNAALFAIFLYGVVGPYGISSNRYSGNPIRQIHKL